MELRAEALSSLIEEVYAAAGNVDRWQALLWRLAQMTHADAGLLLICEADQHYGTCCAVDLPPRLARLYCEVGLSPEPARTITSGGLMLLSSRTDAERGWEFCSRALVSQLGQVGSSGHLCGIVVPLSPGVDGIVLLRRVRSRDVFSAHAPELMSALKIHLQRALSFTDEMRELRALNEIFMASVNAFQTAVLSVDAQGRIQQQSEMAASILCAGDGMMVRKGLLQAVLPGEQIRFLELLRAARAGRETSHSRGDGGPRAGAQRAARVPSKALRSGHGAGGAMLASRMGSPLPLRVTVAPLSGAARAGEPVALVYLDDPALPRNGRGERLRVLYGLSPTESRLANLLLDGISTKEAASALRLTESSARFYLKKIFRATGVNTQSGLIRLMLGLPGDVEPLAARMLQDTGRPGQMQQ